MQQGQVFELKTYAIDGDAIWAKVYRPSSASNTSGSSDSRSDTACAAR